MRILKFYKMCDVPVGIRCRLRELTIGPVAWGLWSLTFHDGSTWCIVAYDGEEAPENAVGWGALTFEYDVLPMIGIYVDPETRQKSIGSLLLMSLLQNALADEVLDLGATVVASTWRWSKYWDICTSCGIKCKTWE